MSCNNNSSGFCAFGSNWWWVIILVLILFWNGNGNGNGKSKNGAVVRQLRFLWFHAAKQPVDRDVQNICKGV